MEYSITWTIQLDGKNPLAAAKEALEIQQDVGSTATVFKVTDKRGKSVLVDLQDDSVTLVTRPKPTQRRRCPECNSIRVGTPTGKKVDFDGSTVLMECFNPKCKHVGDESLF